MPLRVNLMEDATFRSDLMNMAKGILRSVAEGIIRDAVQEDGWLQKRLDSFLSVHPIGVLVGQQIKAELQSRETWDKPMILKLIEEHIKQEVNAAMGALNAKYEARINDMVTKEIRRKLASI